MLNRLDIGEHQFGRIDALFEQKLHRLRCRAIRCASNGALIYPQAMIEPPRRLTDFKVTRLFEMRTRWRE